jgi:hypothetical protein
MFCCHWVGLRSKYRLRLSTKEKGQDGASRSASPTAWPESPRSQARPKPLVAYNSGPRVSRSIPAGNIYQRKHGLKGESGQLGSPQQSSIQRRHRPGPEFSRKSDSANRLENSESNQKMPAFACLCLPVEFGAAGEPTRAPRVRPAAKP